MSDQDVNPEHISDAQPAGTGLVLPGQTLPTTLYVIPIHNRPFFPAQVLPVIVNEEPWAETLELVAKTDHHSLALFFMDNPPEDPRHFDVNSLPEHGTLVRCIMPRARAAAAVRRPGPVAGAYPGLDQAPSSAVHGGGGLSEDPDRSQ